MASNFSMTKLDVLILRPERLIVYWVVSPVFAKALRQGLKGVHPLRFEYLMFLYAGLYDMTASTDGNRFASVWGRKQAATKASM